MSIPTRPVIGASDEVIRHHLAEHPCPPDADSTVVPCPCGDTHALVCRGCGEAVFVALGPGTCCRHFQALIREEPA